MTPEISVIIPTYNRCAMASEAIASVLAQRDASFELIVVDDGSTDGTWDFLGSQPQLRAIRTAHRGPAAVRNRGVAAAQGALIAFLDSDDLWMPAKLKRQSDFMRDNPDCVISQTAETWMRNGRRVNPGKRHLKRAGDIFVDALRTCLISPSAVILRRELLEEVGGFDGDMDACEDYDLWLRILLHHDVGLIDEPLAIRRAGHPDQLSASVPALDRFRIIALAKLLSDAALTGDRRHATAEVLAEKCRIYAKGLLRRGHAESAAFLTEMACRALDQWRHRPDAMLEEVIGSMRATLAHLVTSERAATPAHQHLQTETEQ
jgi:glycosyltransferase involved in cell wall biosynthesis